MYPAPFRYHRPGSLQAAIGLLSRFGNDARIMAGGQSVIPMMKLRVGEASELVDIGRLPDLSYVTLEGSTLRIGALTTHALIAASEEARQIPLVAETAGGIADRQVRSMGTIGGGLSVADPSGCWPTSLRALDTTVQLTGPNGSRSVAIADFVLDSYITVLQPGELVTEIQIPVPGPGTGSAYVAFKRSAAAYPTVSCGVQVTLDGDVCTAASLSLGAAGPTTVVSADNSDNIHAECKSMFFRFVDDLTLHLTPSNGIIHIRSAARTGYSDFGVNRRRVESLRKKLQHKDIIE